MSVYLEVSTHCDDELYDSGNNMPSQPNILSLQSITSPTNPRCLFNTSPKTNETYGKSEKRKLLWAIAFTLVFMVAEFLGGYFSGSLAIMTDAAHLMSDCISFLISVISIWFSNKAPNDKMSFGYRRIEVVGALLSIFGIWALTAVLVFMSMQRLIAEDFEIDADTMIIVAILGVVMNIATAFILHGSCNVIPHLHHGHSHGHAHSHLHSHSQTHLLSSTCTPASTPRICSRSGSPCRKKVRPKLEKLKTGNDKVMEQLTIPNLAPSPSSSPRPSISNSRNNSFAISPSSPSPNLEKMLTMAKKKLNTEDLRQRMSIDVTLSSPDLISSSRFLYNRIDTDDDFSLCPNRRGSVESTKSSSSEERSTCESPKDENLNVRAAIIHVIGDFIQSIGVLIAAIIIKFAPNLKVFDPICTFLFSIIVLVTTARIFRDSMRILLDAVPPGIALDRLGTELNCIPDVKAVHDLNVWSVSTGLNVMTVHLMVDPLADSGEILAAANTIAREGFNIKKCTVQIEKISFYN
ncbi:proton-coupled zinc antiporter SLC30A2-like [Toxorhynchites rutilus septentrionalis]|uniref:proton-coupled zinc antiporter SLC30A2-like n=1 Tax=Toxorhynchites rutilus septentrionalis TaxID=329112 RepID=UPI002479E7A8|nr:proton-coupled zinc antiporter SLC30A2-like [Toxorhynchites rutilus septentrionalis]